ncbi:unnamed protein product [Symbiodinium natans]|uniref:Uncharacterized protein n=1 Tax=Symbiodinium natans TaxID=878477 RepID=A0A812RLU6_9DINO|nr:unnamed protein product [Symbiodinium natans]
MAAMAAMAPMQSLQLEPLPRKPEEEPIDGPSGHLPDGSPDGVEHLPDGSPDGMEQFQRSGARRYQSHRNPMPTVPRSWEAMNIHTLARAEPEQAAEPGQPDLRAASAPPILPNAPPKILCRVCRKAALGIRMRTCRAEG